MKPIEVWVSNVIVGNDVIQHIMEKQPVKKLPIHVLMADTSFTKWLKMRVPESAWKSLPKDKVTGMPKVKIIYLKYLSESADSPNLIY